MAERPEPPEGLQEAGSALWEDVWGELPETLEFDGRERAILAAACRQADTISALEVAIGRDGEMVAGSAGQPRLHPAITEARQARLALSRLLGEIELPNAEGKPESAASARGRRAVSARWDRKRALREARGA